MKYGEIPCQNVMKNCKKDHPKACNEAFMICNYAETIPYELSGYNPYDMRLPCENLPLCYDFSAVELLLNDEKFQKEINVMEGSSWKSCNLIVNKIFMADFMRSYHGFIPDLLHAGLEVLIYAGDVDFTLYTLIIRKVPN